MTAPPRVRDVQDRLVGRQHETVRPFLLARQQLELAVRPQAIDAVERKLAQRRVVHAFQAERRIGEVHGAVARDDEIVRAVEPLAFETIGECRPAAVLLEPNDRTATVDADEQTALCIERHAVRPDAAQPGAVAGEERLERSRSRRRPRSIDRSRCRAGRSTAGATRRCSHTGPSRNTKPSTTFSIARAGGHERIEARIEADDDTGTGRRFGLRGGR